MKNYIIAVVLVLTMAVCFSSCKETEKTVSGDNPDTPHENNTLQTLSDSDSVQSNQPDGKSDTPYTVDTEPPADTLSSVNTNKTLSVTNKQPDVLFEPPSITGNEPPAAETNPSAATNKSSVTTKSPAATKKTSVATNPPAATKKPSASATNSPASTTKPSETKHKKGANHTHTISFNGNGNTGGSGSSPGVVKCEDDYVIPKDTAFIFTRDGYAFAGWNTKAGGNGSKYMPGDKVREVDEDIILYAQWKAV